MANLEVRIRHADDLQAMPFAEIPLRENLIMGVVDLIESVGGFIRGVDVTEGTLSYQFADDGVSAYLEVVISDPSN